MTALPYYFFERLRWYSNNSTRINTGRIGMIIHNKHLKVCGSIFYGISSSAWPYRSCMDPILVDSTKCTHDMHKSYVASSYKPIMREGDWCSSTIVIL